MGKGLLYVLCLGVAAFAGYAYGFKPLGAMVHPDMRAAFVAHPLGVYAHVFAALFAMALGAEPRFRGMALDLRPHERSRIGLMVLEERPR